MNKTEFTAQQLLVLMDESLTSAQVSRLLHMSPSTIRYHRIKMNTRVKSRKAYGIVSKLVSDLGVAIFDEPVKAMAYRYNCDIHTIKRARKFVREMERKDDVR